MTAEQLRKDTESRLESIFHIRVKLDDLAEHKRLCVIGESKFHIFVSNLIRSIPMTLPLLGIFCEFQKHCRCRELPQVLRRR